MSQRMLRIRLLASKDCVASAACISPEARATQEAMQAAAVIHEIRKMKELITADDREQLVELAKEIGFSADIFMSILNAFADLKMKGKRRQGQLHHHHHHHRHHHQHCHHLILILFIIILIVMIKAKRTTRNSATFLSKTTGPRWRRRMRRLTPSSRSSSRGPTS